MKRLALPAACALCACAPELAEEPAPDVIRARWDPSAGVLPTPTDLVRDAEAGKLALPEDPSLPAAELELRRFLNGLDGYPLSTPLALPVTGPLDPATLEGKLSLFELGTGAEVALALDVSDGLLKAFPPGTTPAEDGPATSLASGRAYTFVLEGYEGGVRGAAGEPVVADAAFFLVKSRGDLALHPDAMPGASRTEKQATAARLAGVQDAFAPLVEAAEDRGVPRERVAVLGSFTTTTQPAVWFDPLSGRIPLPNELLRDRDTGTVTLPVKPEDSEEQRHLKEGLSTYDGFSTTAGVTLKTTHPVDRDSATGEGRIRLFRLDTLEEHTDLLAEVLEDGSGFSVRPALALEHGVRYAYVLADGVRDSSGKTVVAQPAGAMLRFASPLSVDGRSQVGSLDDASAARLEPARKDLEPLLGKLVAEGLSRDRLAAAVPFTTTTAPEQALALRARLYQDDVPVEPADVLVATPFERGLLAVLPSVETVVSGTIPTLDTLDPYTTASRPGGGAEVRPISFVLTIPRRATPGEPIPVVLFGHGLMTSRELAYLLADRLALAGYAVFSIDLPLHGERAICKQDSECANGATCADDHACVDPDGSRGEVAKLGVDFIPGSPAYPVTSGTYFVDVEDLFASRDHFRQAVLDLCQGVRAIRGPSWPGLTGGYVLDGADVSYVGMSLGGILGADLAAIEPTIGTFVLNVPGAGLVDLMQESAVFGPQLTAGLGARGIEPGSPEMAQFEGIARWVLDPVDPINYAHHAVHAPLTYVDPVDGVEKSAPPKRVLVQMAVNDLVVPNPSSERLARRMGVDLVSYTPLVSNHGFLFDPTSIQGLEAREDLVEFLDAR